MINIRSLSDLFWHDFADLAYSCRWGVAARADSRREVVAAVPEQPKEEEIPRGHDGHDASASAAGGAWQKFAKIVLLFW